MKEEWLFWRLVEKDFSIFVNQDHISYPEMCKLNAIIDRKEDQDSAYHEYMREKLNKDIK